MPLLSQQLNNVAFILLNILIVEDNFFFKLLENVSKD